MGEAQSIWSLVDKGGTLALAIVFLVAFIRGWIVPRWAYDALKDNCTVMTQLAERNADLGHRLTDAMETRARRSGRTEGNER